MKSEIFGFPADIISDVPSVKMIGNGKVEILNHKGLKECDSNRISVSTKIGIICIEGEKLVIKEINGDCLSMEGRINKIEILQG